MKKSLMIIILFCFSQLVYANSDIAVNSGFLDDILRLFSNFTKTWSEKLLPVAVYLYWFLASLEFLYQIAFKKLLANDIAKIWYFMIMRVMIVTLLSYFALNLDFYLALVNYFTKLGSVVGGTDFTINNGGEIIFSPSLLITAAWGKVSPIIVSVAGLAVGSGVLNGSVANFLLMFVFVIVGTVLIIVAIAMITVIEAYFIIFAGIFLSGAAGSSWTMNYWQRYLSYVAGVAIRLFCTSLLIGIFYEQWKQMPDISFAGSVDDVVSNIGNYIKYLMLVTFAFVFDLILLVTIPSRAASMLNGVVNSRLGDSINSVSAMLSGSKINAVSIGSRTSTLKDTDSGIYHESSTINNSGRVFIRDTVSQNKVSTSHGDQWKSAVQSKTNAVSKSVARDQVSAGFKTAVNNANQSSIKM